MRTSSSRASVASSTGVFPFFVVWLGPRTDDELKGQIE
jgi:hypothetical protein